ncbi:MAG: hypothetical protein GC182_08855 [Rhodopseudomonas sp.]|nr:hypothetical protein [Rhodopseudomonas sp.]
MAGWLLKNFSGEQPRIGAHLLPANAAQAAVNVRLDDGDLTPLRKPQHVYSIPAYPGGYKTIFKYQDNWLGWANEVKCALGPVASDRLYITGDGAPKMRVGATIYGLALAAPTAGLTAAVTDSGTGDTITSIYVYTFVTAYGEESEPCAASDDVVWQAGQTVTLSGFQAPPAGRNITKQRIYRTQTGTSGTDLYFIDERDASSADYVDAIAVDAFGEVLPSRAYNPPPDTLAGLTSMPNGMMAAFSGRDLYFCEPWQPHAWPEVYILTTDFDIVALGAIGSSLIIMTKGCPYFAQGTDPASMQMVKIESNLPCINARGVQDLGYAIAYPSHEGLVMATASGQASIVTETLFNRPAWQLLSPGTMCAGQLSGRYIGSYNSVDALGRSLTGSLIIQGASAPIFLSRSDVKAQAFHYDITDGALYFLDDSTGEIKQFDPPGGVPIDQFWKSKPVLLSAADNFGVIQIDGDAVPSPADVANITAAKAVAITANSAMLADPLGSEINGSAINEFPIDGDGLSALPDDAKTMNVSVYADGDLIAAISKVGEVVRLPSGFKSRKWEIAVSGTVRIEQIVMARTPAELAAMGAS